MNFIKYETMNLLGRIRRRNGLLNPPFESINSSFQTANTPSIADDQEWKFLTVFKQDYGTRHPFFYACGLKDTMKMAGEEKKFVFVYFHEPNHPFTRPFCQGTLCSDVVIEFLDVNFVSWGAMVGSGEGREMLSTLRPESFPFCALVAPTSRGDSMTILQQMEGPLSAGELVEILQRTMEEQGLAFCDRKQLKDKEEMIRRKGKEEDKIREDRRLKEEQNAAYMAALTIDKERERFKNLASERVQRSGQIRKTENNDTKRQNPSTQNRFGTAKPTLSSRESRGKDSQTDTTQILIRFPNGERKEKSFSCTDKIQSVYGYIDSSGIPGLGKYRLVSSFPRRIYGLDQKAMSLKEAGLYPRASLFLEPM